MGYDNDEAGQRGIDKFDRLRKERRMEPFEVCFPPSGHKDWNSAHIANFDLDSHITRNSMEFVPLLKDKIDRFKEESGSIQVSNR